MSQLIGKPNHALNKITNQSTETKQPTEQLEQRPIIVVTLPFVSTFVTIILCIALTTYMIVLRSSDVAFFEEREKEFLIKIDKTTNKLLLEKDRRIHAIVLAERNFGVLISLVHTFYAAFENKMRGGIKEMELLATTLEGIMQTIESCSFAPEENYLAIGNSKMSLPACD